MLVPPHYQLGEKLSENKSSTVFRAIDLRSREHVVLKWLNHSSDAVGSAFFQREFETTRLFQQNNIIRAISIEFVERSPLICFEDIHGISLSRYCQHRRLHPKRFFKIAIDVAHALRDIHAAGVIHKDINPDNIIFNEKTGQVQVIDFGIASRVGREFAGFDGLDHMVGTPAFMAPEQTGRMNRSLNFRADFYSLGATLHRLATGSNPFPGSDLAEVIHAQLARRPIPIHALNEDYPQQISRIVAKLLEKAPEDRYQSAEGLIWDLEESMRLFEQHSIIETFQIGTHDIETHFQLSEKLYGRDQEIGQMLDFFETICRDSSGLFLVGGFSGVGKTSLIHETHRAITAKRGFFISGKFDQLERNTPFLPFVQSYRALVQQILMVPESLLRSWCERIFHSMNGLGGALTDLIPELELLIGPQSPVISLPALESNNRFNLVLRKFTAAVTSQGFPLVLFLDDLQWADGASLKLLESLIEDPEIHHMLVIGAYRSNEVSHSFGMTLAYLRGRARLIRELQLQPLQLEDIAAMLGDSFHRGSLETRPLALLCREKTDGNPFFLGQFLKSLVEAGAIHFDRKLRYWVWDLEQIQGMTVTANLVSLIEARFRRLPARCREFLATAACLGHRFSLATLAHLAGISPLELGETLEPALREGLLLALGGHNNLIHFTANSELAFAHDRFQQAAYLEHLDPAATHYRIGRLLLNVNTNSLYELVNHLNLGRAKISYPDEWLDLIQRNLLAARAAKRASAFELGERFSAIGLEMLEHPLAQSFPHGLSLRIDFLRERVEFLFLLRRYDALALTRDQFLQLERDPLRTVSVHEFQIAADMASMHFEHALQVGLAALHELGLHIPTHPSQTLVLFKLLACKRRVKRWLKRHSQIGLSPLPAMTRPQSLAAMRILQRLMTSAYSVRPNLMAYIVCTMIESTLDEGQAPESAYGLAAYALVMAGLFREEELAKQLGEIALELARSHGDPSLLARVMHLINMFIRSRSIAFAELVRFAVENYRIALEAGDFEYAAMAIMTYIVFRIFGGDSLWITEPDVCAFITELDRLKQETVMLWCQILHQAQLNYLGRCEDPCSLVGRYFGPDCEQKLLGLRDTKAIFMFYQQQFSLAVYYRRPKEAREMAHKLQPYVKEMLGSVGEAEYWSSHSQMLLFDIDQVGPLEKWRRWARIRANQQKLRHWAKLGPDNHLSRYIALKAELARLEGRYGQAHLLFDRAITIASRTKATFSEGFAAELAGEMFVRIKKPLLSRFYIQHAYLSYQRAGADGKVSDLETRYPHIITPENRTEEPTSIVDSTLGRRAELLLDLSSAMRAAQALSAEIRLESLNGRMLRILIENAGATRGSLLVERDHDLILEADSRVWNGELIGRPLIREPASYSGDHALPVGIVKYVLRTRKPLVIEDALLDSSFGKDPYVLHTRIKSVLCLPLLHHGTLVGALYLENELTSNAFPLKSIDLLQFIAAQVAISQQNARLFEALSQSNLELEQRVVERTLELAEKNEQLLSGIRYAERIQNAILPDLRQIKGLLTNFMVLFQPLNLISGDFYWFAHHEPYLFFAVVDCTGHGVPGALMSMIGNTILNKIINENRVFEPNQVLDLLHLDIQKALKQDNLDLRSRDGMDLGLLRLDRRDWSGKYAGARRPLLLLRGDRLEEIRADRKSIGGGLRKAQPNFSVTTLQLQPDDLLYMTTDGFADQSNSAGERYGTPRLNQYLLSIREWDLYSQSEALKREFDHHRGSTPQRDDITLLALKIPKN